MFQALELKTAYYKEQRVLGNGERVRQGRYTEARKEIGLYLKAVERY